MSSSSNSSGNSNSPSKKTPHWNKDAVRSAASNRWEDILSRVAGITSPDRDGSPCPKCGGTNRFFRHTDFHETGGVGCRSCFSTDNQDGFAVVSWALGIPFSEAVDRIGEFLGVRPESGDAVATSRAKAKRKRDTVDGVVVETWPTDLALYWCSKFQPINEPGLLSSGAASIRVNGRSYLGFPGVDDRGVIIAWTILDWSGAELPIGRPGEGKSAKTKLVDGSKGGSIIGSLNGDIVWKVEGPKDLAAMLSAGLPDNHSAFSTSNGASEKPSPWIIRALIGKRVVLIHDADAAGVAANEKWSKALAAAGVEHKIINLPFEVVGSHGKDLRDFLRDVGTVEGLRQMAREAPPVAVAPPELQTIPEDTVEEAPDDPFRLARENLAHYESKFGGRVICWQGQWFTWRGSVYKRKQESEIKAHLWSFVKEEFDREHKQAKAERREVEFARKVSTSIIENTMAAMRSLCQIRDELAPPSWIDGREARATVSVRNGLLDLDRLTNLDLNQSTVDDLHACLTTHSSDWFSLVSLRYDFDPYAKCPKWLKFLERSLDGSREKIDTLQEWAGYLLLPDTSFQKFLAIQGAGGNGKSVFLAGMTALLGPENVSAVPIEEFGERFALASTLGKLANIVDETPESDMPVSKIRAYTSGSRMTFEFKGKQPFEAMPTARLMFSCNAKPRFRDSSDAIWRRMLWIEFGRPIQPGERILGMDKPQWWIESGELPGMLNWAVWGLYRLKKRGDFSIGAEMAEQIEAYRREANPAREFIAEHLEWTGNVDDYVRASEVYKTYCDWARENGHHAANASKFNLAIRDAFPKSNRRKIRVINERPWVHDGIRLAE